MRARRVASVVVRQYFLLRGSPARVVPLFAWVAVDIVLWGFISRYLGTLTRGGLHLFASLLGAVLLWNFLTRVMQGVTMAFFEDVWSRNFLNVFASPLSIGEYVVGLVLASIATSAVGLGVMLGVASGVFGLSLGVYGLMFLPFLGVLFMFGTALGILGSAIVLRLGPSAEWFVWPIPALLSPFAGVFYPLSTLPAWMQCVSRVLPPSYVFEGIRAIARGQQVPVGALPAALGLAGLHIVLACWLFVRVHHQAVRSGLLARYSAESVG